MKNSVQFLGVFFLISIFIGVSSLCANADEIYLKDGSVIKGKILESKDNVSYRILTTDGSEIMYPVDEVKKVKITDASPKEGIKPDSVKSIDSIKPIDQEADKSGVGQPTSSSDSGINWGGHGSSRRGKGEYFIFAQQCKSADSTSGGVVLDFENTSMFGIGFGSNLNDHVNINMDLYYGSLPNSTSVYAYGQKINVKSDASVLGWDIINLDVYLLKERITPFLSGGVGFMNFFGDVEGLTFNEYDFSYNYGIGVRWDAADHLLIKLLYKTTSVTLEGADDSTKFSGLSAAIGYRF
jgi:opacity protein-like surface antigen